MESDRSALGLVLVIRDETAAADAGGSRVRSVLRDLVQPDTQAAQVFGVGAGSVPDQVQPADDGGLRAAEPPPDLRRIQPRSP